MSEQTEKQWQKERKDTIKYLKVACEEFGDLDWDEDLHLVDILEKHLIRYISG